MGAEATGVLGKSRKSPALGGMARVELEVGLGRSDKGINQISGLECRTWGPSLCRGGRKTKKAPPPTKIILRKPAALGNYREKGHAPFLSV